MNVPRFPILRSFEKILTGLIVFVVAYHKLVATLQLEALTTMLTGYSCFLFPSNLGKTIVLNSTANISFIFSLTYFRLEFKHLFKMCFRCWRWSEHFHECTVTSSRFKTTLRLIKPLKLMSVTRRRATLASIISKGFYKHRFPTWFKKLCSACPDLIPAPNYI